MTPQEIEIIELSTQLFTKCNNLPVMRDDDMKRVCDAIHTIQHTVMVRPTRRHNPDIFPTIKNNHLYNKIE